MERQQKGRPRRHASTGQRAQHTSPARLIVPAALAICLLLVLVTFATAGKPDKGGEEVTQSAAAKKEEPRSDERSSDATNSSQQEKDSDSDDSATEPTGPALYKVKPGDSLGAIAERTGVEASDLAELNPDVDPRALQPGQQLKLR